MASTRSDDGHRITVNGKCYEVGEELPQGMSLLTYLRNILHLTGTKYMCKEGGCGACTVSITVQDPVTKKDRTLAVNSCLLPVYSGLARNVTTIEGLGSQKKGLSIEQCTLADGNGSQCGMCTPGMIMNFHSLSHDKKVTMDEIEKSFGGNICRCTGYRPILAAFKSLASDAPPELYKMCPDIEDVCVRSCQRECITKQEKGRCLKTTRSATIWKRPSTVDEIFSIFEQMPVLCKYMLVGGNTAHGVYRRTTEPDLYIDVSGVKELHDYSVGSKVVKLGANMTLTDLLSTLKTISKDYSSLYSYTQTLAEHVELIASIPIRNIGTIAGNLSIKHQHPEFPSDLFLILETVGASLEIASSRSSHETVSLPDYLKLDMDRKLIVNVILPPLGSSYTVRTYKIMPRAQNAHAYVNAGFCFKLDQRNSGEVKEKPHIVYGGINPQFIHAARTETYLQGKKLFNGNVLKAALRTLDSELKPDHVLPDATPKYRKGLAEALLYKFILSLSPKGVPSTHKSGGTLLTRPVSSATQSYESNRSLWPLNKPVIKMEAYAQATGEAEYLDDMPPLPGELHIAFVLTKEGPGTLQSVDTSQALLLPGVVTYYGPDAIPGKNNFTKFTPPLYGLNDVEEIFCSGKVLYAGQPVGMIVAETQVIAQAAAALVKVIVSTTQKPLLTIEEVLQSGDKARIKEEVKPKTVNLQTSGNLTDTLLNWWAATEESTHTLKGKFHVNSQYHYTLETQCCLCVPIEDGMDVFSATMWMDQTNVAVAACLGICENRINIKVRRLGGGYGAKISRSVPIACACAIAAFHLNRPVRYVMLLEDNMEALGKRQDLTAEYEVQCNDEGKITSMNTALYQDSGCSFNESCLPDFTVDGFKNGYDASKWSVSGTTVLTDIPSNTWARGPGTFEGMVCAEAIMEHIADELQLDPVDVRLKNIDPQEPNLRQITEQLRKSSNYDKRKEEVEKFNKENRWKKRGISLNIMKFPIIYFGGYYSLVSVYHVDGSVAVCHGGIECGQGINTKVAQVAAKFFGIELEKVLVKPSNNLTAPNSDLTGASITSETCAYATMKCCQEILKRLEPVKKKLVNPTWNELVAEGYNDNIDMCASYMFKPDDAKEYGVEGVAVAECEVDILTGEKIICRVDILENAGVSMSPELDIGQIEGAFMMGLGCLTSEELVFEPETGRLLTNRTWNYKVPGARDIPIVWNVALQGNIENPAGVLRSKTTGEPAICLSSSVFFAIKKAIQSARKDAGFSEKYFAFDTPATVERIFLHCDTNYDQFIL